MNNKQNLYKKILDEYRKKQDLIEKTKIKKQEAIYAEIPLVKEIDQEMNRYAIQAGIDILRGKNPDYISQLEELEAAKLAQLVMHGYDKDYLAVDYQCKKCKDTGFIDGEECSCFKQNLAKEYYKMSNIEAVLKKHNFSTFDFSVFSDDPIPEEGRSARENMLDIYKASEKFIRNFDLENETSLLFYGETGLGKTFMTNCIAKELLDLGYTVVYQTAHKILEIIEEYKFGKTDDILEAKRKYEFLLEADLLIIDDLGTELNTSFTTSEIFNILNSRNLANKKIIISTNLSPAEIAKNYTDRVYSRILEKFSIYKFIGNDLRWRGY